MSAVDDAFFGLRAMIVGGRLRPGDRLPSEAELAAELEVSRGPLREAMKMLAVLGVLESRQGSGTYVSALRADDLVGGLGLTVEMLPLDGLLDIYELRRVLEAYAASQAAARATPAEAARILELAAAQAAEEDPDAAARLDNEFHRAIVDAAHNDVLAALLEVFRMAGRHYRLFVGPQADRIRTTSGAAHRALAEAVAEHDPAAASSVASEHVAQTMRWLREIAPARLLGPAD